MKAGLPLPADVLDHSACLLLLGCADHGGSMADHRCFFMGDGSQVAPEMFTVVESDLAQGDDRSAGMGCGGVQATAQSHLKHQQLDALTLEMNQRRCSQQFERCEPVPPAHLLEIQKQ